MHYDVKVSILHLHSHVFMLMSVLITGCGFLRYERVSGTEADLPPSRFTDESGNSGEPNSAACEERYNAPIFCEDFEQTLNTKWYNIPGHREPLGPRLTTERSRFGDSSLRVETHSDEGRASYMDADFPEIADGNLYIRLFAFIPEGQEASHVAIFDIGHPDLPPGSKLGLDRGSSDRLYWFSNLADDSSATSPEGTLPIGRWFCLELAALREQGMSVSVDDEVLVSTEPYDPFGGQAVSRIRFGQRHLDGADHIVFYDELVISQQPVGCGIP